MQRLSLLDTFFFAFYAIAIFSLGGFSDYKDPRCILTLSLCMCAIFLVLFGIGYYLNIHQLFFYCLVWGLEAVFQALCWPAVMTVLGHWFVGTSRHFTLGLWCSCKIVGNFVGVLVNQVAVASIGAESWGATMLLCAVLVFLVALLVFLTLTPEPHMVGAMAHGKLKECDDDDHEGTDGLEESLLEEEEQEEGEDPTPLGVWKALCIPGVLDVSLSFAAFKVGKERKLDGGRTESFVLFCVINPSFSCIGVLLCLLFLVTGDALHDF